MRRARLQSGRQGSPMHAALAADGPLWNSLSRSLERLRQLFPLRHQRAQFPAARSSSWFCRCVSSALTKVSNGCLAVSNRRLDSRNVFLDLVDAIFHLLALDRIQTFALRPVRSSRRRPPNFHSHGERATFLFTSRVTIRSSTSRASAHHQASAQPQHDPLSASDNPRSSRDRFRRVRRRFQTRASPVCR